MADPTTVDRIAFAFHWEYERAAKRTGWATQSATQVPWDELPEANRQTMRATVAALLDLGVIAESGPDHSGPPPSGAPLSQQGPSDSISGLVPEIGGH